MHGLVAALGSAARRLTREAIVHHLGPPAAAVPLVAETASLLPVKRDSLVHLWGPRLRRCGLQLPLFEARVAGVRGDYDKWAEWFQASLALRARVGELLPKIGLAHADHLQSKLEDIEHGRELGAGELAHLAALAHLLTALPARVTPSSRSVTGP